MKNPPLSKRKTATYLLFPGILATIYVWMWMWGMGLRLKRGAPEEGGPSGASRNASQGTYAPLQGLKVRILLQ